MLHLLFLPQQNFGTAVGHGIGHHTTTETIDFGKSDLLSLSQFLGKKDYFFGKQPHQLDVVAFGHIAQFVYVPFEGIKEWMETETPNLIAFVERIKAKYWPDWEDILKTLEINTHLPKKELTPEEIEAQKKAEEKKAEDARKKEEKLKEKVRKAELKKKAKQDKQSASSSNPASSDPASSLPDADATEGDKNPEEASTSNARPPLRSSQSFRLPTFVSITRTLSNVTRKTGTYRFSSSPQTPEQEEKKKQKEEEKRKAKEEKDRKKKEAEEAKAKAAAEKAEKEKAEKEKKEAEAKAAAEAKVVADAAPAATGEASADTKTEDKKESPADKKE